MGEGEDLLHILSDMSVKVTLGCLAASMLVSLLVETCNSDIRMVIKAQALLFLPHQRYQFTQIEF